MKAWLVVALVACGHPAGVVQNNTVEREDRHPCDPGMETTALAVPIAEQLATTCGDGKVGGYTASCTRSCAIGCGVSPDCGNTCVAGRELCDGGDFDGRTCQQIRFGPGALACDATCSKMSTTGCSLCVGKDCREITIAAPFQPVDGLRLSALGNDVRAFWIVESGHLVTALVKRDMSFAGDPVDLGERPAMMGPVTTTSKGWITIAGDGDHWAITFIDTHDKVTRAALGEPQADFKVARVTGADEVIVISGDLGSNAAQVVRVDATGKILPLPSKALHAANGFDRFVIAPLPEGTTTLGAGTKSLEVTAAKGDHVIAWFHSDDPAYGGVARLHDGIRVEAQTDGSTKAPFAITGPVSVAFDGARDTVGTKTFAVAPVPAPLADVAPFAEVVNDQPIARAMATSFELRAGMVSEETAPVRIVLAVLPK